MTKIKAAILWPLATIVGWLINTSGSVIDAGNTELLDALDQDET